MSREVLTSLNSCRLIIRRGVGYDNIDLEAAMKPASIAQAARILGDWYG